MSVHGVCDCESCLANRAMHTMGDDPQRAQRIAEAERKVVDAAVAYELARRACARVDSHAPEWDEWDLAEHRFRSAIAALIEARR